MRLPASAPGASGIGVGTITRSENVKDEPQVLNVRKQRLGHLVAAAALFDVTV
jgi:hypothetical protein